MSTGTLLLIWMCNALKGVFNALLLCCDRRVNRYGVVLVHRYPVGPPDFPAPFTREQISSAPGMELQIADRSKYESMFALDKANGLIDVSAFSSSSAWLSKTFDAASSSKAAIQEHIRTCRTSISTLATTLADAQRKSAKRRDAAIKAIDAAQMAVCEELAAVVEMAEEEKALSALEFAKESDYEMWRQQLTGIARGTLEHVHRMHPAAKKLLDNGAVCQGGIFEGIDVCNLQRLEKIAKVRGQYPLGLVPAHATCIC